MRVAMVADHNGAQLKARLAALARALGHEVDERVGAGMTDSALATDTAIATDTGAVVDYPPLCEDACRQILTGAADRAVVVGGSGMGETIACNKLAGIRAGLCHDVFTTRISRANNDANVMVIGAKVIDGALAGQLLDLWLRTAFTGGVHSARLAQIAALERGETLL